MTPQGRAVADRAPHACRPGCAACCIAPSISSPIPVPAVSTIAAPTAAKRSGEAVVDLSAALPKPAGVACPQLSIDLRCRLFGSPLRPAVCASLRPEPEMCGDSREHAMQWLARLERETGPGQTAAA